MTKRIRPQKASPATRDEKTDRLQQVSLLMIEGSIDQKKRYELAQEWRVAPTTVDGYIASAAYLLEHESPETLHAAKANAIAQLDRIYRESLEQSEQKIEEHDEPIVDPKTGHTDYRATARIKTIKRKANFGVALRAVTEKMVLLNLSKRATTDLTIELKQRTEDVDRVTFALRSIVAVIKDALKDDPEAAGKVAIAIQAWHTEWSKQQVGPIEAPEPEDAPH